LLACLSSGLEYLTTSIPFYKRETIAAQCVWGGTSRSCARFIGTNDNEGCIAGFSGSYSSSDTTYIESMTAAEAEAVCQDLDPNLILSDKACTGTGCNYDSHPVYTKQPCTSIPSGGVQVLAGREGTLVTCLQPGVDDITTTADYGRQIIAAQCCDPVGGACRRNVGSNDDEGCIAGFSGEDGDGSGVTQYTWSAAYAKCDSLGLELCETNCGGTGCYYDYHPVYTKLPCS